MRVQIDFDMCASTGGCKPAGQQDTPTPVAPAEQLPLRVVVVDDAELAEVVQREWNSRPGGQCKVTELSSAELLAWDQPRLGADIVIYPSALLGELAERGLIEPIAEDDLQARFCRSCGTQLPTETP